MKRGSRLSVALHALLHMAERTEPLTSEALAVMLHTHAVVVRRTMAGLRARGIVSSEKGHGGGWRFSGSLETLTLGDVYEALGAPDVFAIGPRVEQPGCPVERAVNRAMGAALEEAEAVFHGHLRDVTLASIAADVKKKKERMRPCSTSS
ncbi:MAG: Rrf2 family transcriptional regulator [Polyangiaceae bacterium]